MKLMKIVLAALTACVLALGQLSAASATTDTSATFAIDGVPRATGETIQMPYGTTFVNVDVFTTDPNATFEVFDDANLVIGLNVVAVIVTSADATATAESRFNVVVSGPSTDATSSIMIDGVSRTGGATLALPHGRNSVAVAVTPTNPAATFTVTGDTGLTTGNNTVVVTVTAQDGVSRVESIFQVSVAAPSTDATAAVTIDGTNRANNATINQPFGTTEIAVVVVPTSSAATYVVNGATGLRSGNNTVSVIVTAEDTVSTFTYTYNVVVAGQDLTTATFTVSGASHANGDTVVVPAGTTSVDIVATTVDANATWSVANNTGLVSGNNTVQVTVTARDGVTTETSTFFVYVSSPTVPAPTLTRPNAPADVVGKPGNGQATVSWAAPTDNGGSAVTAYLVEVSADSGQTWKSAGRATGLNLLVTQLTNGKSYKFRVIAVNGVGQSAPSNASMAVVPTAAVAPSVTVKASQSISFAAEASKLSTAQKVQIKKFVAMLGLSKLTIKVAGYTKASKSTAKGVALAKARSANVLAYLRALRVVAKLTSTYSATGAVNSALISATWQK
jgi:outer membrane protein OmpA-like peptidoglycan-associated protein